MNEPGELQTLFDNAADEFVAAEPDVSQWAGWIVYFCEMLEAKAESLDPDHPQGIELMFEEIAEELIRRVAEGSW